MDQAVTAQAMLTDLLRPGSRVFVAGVTGQSQRLRDELSRRPGRARGVDFTCVQFPGIDTTDYAALHAEASITGALMSPSMRIALQRGRARLLPLDYLGLARHLAAQPPFDLVIAQLGMPDADGWCSPGLASDFVPLVWRQARQRVAHLNPRLPRFAGSFRVHVSELDAVVRAEAPLLCVPDPPATDAATRIGGHAAELIRDGDTLQFGIGAVPPAIGSALTSHRRLRVHSGVVTPALRTLWDAQALDRDARITAGVVLGNDAFYDFAGRLEPLYLTDVRHTHGLDALASIHRFIAINSAVEVDLFGQVNSERGNGVMQAGAGGLPAFAQGAHLSREGRLLICLPSTARGGSVSRIVPALDRQSLCTVPRHLGDAVVTEYGVAELHGRTVDERAQALIGVAHPDHRSRLATEWDAIRRRL